MDRLTFKSIINCAKELDALEKLIISESFSYAMIADWVAEISWNITNVTGKRRTEYKSDEFQHRLKKLVKEVKQVKQAKVEDISETKSKDWREDD